jgi:CRISPR-associated protein Cmx8
VAKEKKPKTDQAKKKGGGSPLELTYTLAELPSSQHRAGLAALAFMVDWLERAQIDDRGVCEITQLDARGLTIKIDAQGLTQLFNLVYEADHEEQAVSKPWKNKPPLREEDVVVQVRGKAKTKKVYFYPVVVPRGAFLVEWDRAADDAGKGPWVKLWRDMVWSILRGVPAQRAPFNSRAEGKPIKEATDAWKALRKPGSTVALPSTYFLGAQAVTAENVPFKDRARFQFLLHFWPFVAQIYVPTVVDNEGKNNHLGYAIAVPDVADLEAFIEDLPEALALRFGGDESKILGYRPKGCLVDLSAEAALDLFAKLKRRLVAREGSRQTSDLVLGVDVFHMTKDGNNVRVLGSGRVDPIEGMIDEYSRVRGTYWSHLFRLQRLKNLIAGAPWYAGFGPIFSTRPGAQTIGDKYFKHDARRAFEESKTMSETASDNETTAAPTLEGVLYQMVGSFISRKVKSKYDIDYEASKQSEKKTKDYREAREKVAREAFLAARSRTGGDFVDFFTSTICSIPQHIKREEYALIGRALLDPAEVENIRTLTMLALSARG